MVTNILKRTLNIIINYGRALIMAESYSSDISYQKLVMTHNGHTVESKNLTPSFQETVRLRLEIEMWKGLATIDPVTGINNRRSFNNIVEKYFEQVAKDRHLRESDSEEEKKKSYIVYLDSFDFKAFNTVFSHEGGDQILKTTAQEIDNEIRNSDFLARIGGDEFAIFIMNTTQEDITNLSERLKNKFNPFMAQCQGYKVGIIMTIGVIEIDSTSSIEENLRMASISMYEEKVAQSRRYPKATTLLELLKRNDVHKVQEWADTKPPMKQIPLFN